LKNRKPLWKQQVFATEEVLDLALLELPRGEAPIYCPLELPLGETRRRSEYSGPVLVASACDRDADNCEHVTMANGYATPEPIGDLDREPAFSLRVAPNAGMSGSLVIGHAGPIAGRAELPRRGSWWGIAGQMYSSGVILVWKLEALRLLLEGALDD
jgi:hypothetical protein